MQELRQLETGASCSNVRRANEMSFWSGRDKTMKLAKSRMI